MTEILLCYDIATASPDGERRLRDVASICERYGHRVQYSVFECRLDEVSEQHLISELVDVIDPSEDSVFLYHLARPFADVRHSLGRDGRDWSSALIV